MEIILQNIISLLPGIKIQIPFMKNCLYVIFALLLNFIFGCTNPTPAQQVLAAQDSSKFSTKKRIDELRSSGELFDSCQYPYHGNCIYRLCASVDLTSVADSTPIGGNSRKLVTYMEKPRLIVDKGEAYFRSNNSFEIYSHVIFKSDYGDVAFNEFLNMDVAYSKKNGQIVSDKGKFITSDNYIGHIYKFDMKATGQYLAIAYINITKYIIMIVFSANNKIAYDNEYKYFAAVVKSFKYYGD